MHRVLTPEKDCLSECSQNLTRFQELQQLLIQSAIEKNRATSEMGKIGLAEQEMENFLQQISGQYNTGKFYMNPFRKMIKEGPKFSTLARVIENNTDNIYHVTNNDTINGDLAKVVINPHFIKSQTAPSQFQEDLPEHLENYHKRAFKKVQVLDNCQVLFHDSFFQELIEYGNADPRILNYIQKYSPAELPDKNAIEKQREASRKIIESITMPTPPAPIYRGDLSIRKPQDFGHPVGGYNLGGCGSGSGGCDSGGCSSGGCASKKIK